MEENIASMGSAMDDLPFRTDLLENIIGSEFDALSLALWRSQASGVFMVLESTTSKRARGVLYSRAGLYLKNQATDTSPDSSPAVTYLRGFPDIAFRRGMVLDSQWAMEFDIENEAYYSMPLTAAYTDPSIGQKIYYWQPSAPISGTAYRAMLCSAPLVDSGGNVFGVCGFEVSDEMFESMYATSGAHENMSCAVAPIDGDVIDISRALSSRIYSDSGKRLSSGGLSIAASKNGFFTYRSQNGDAYAGMHRTLNIYPENSPFSGEKFAMLLMVPQAAVDVPASARNRRFVCFSLFLLALGTCLSFFLSKWNAIPAAQDLDSIKTTGLDAAGGIGAYIERNAAGLPKDRFDEFVKNTETLSRAEKKVFDMYVKGYSASEIADALNLSVNTVKSHNRRIFLKMNVSSKKELLARLRQILEDPGQSNANE
jgi:DNA-binding CsgD family transcriptional regulator